MCQRSLLLFPIPGPHLHPQQRVWNHAGDVSVCAFMRRLWSACGVWHPYSVTPCDLLPVTSALAQEDALLRSQGTFQWAVHMLSPDLCDNTDWQFMCCEDNCEKTFCSPHGCEYFLFVMAVYKIPVILEASPEWCQCRQQLYYCKRKLKVHVFNKCCWQ